MFCSDKVARICLYCGCNNRPEGNTNYCATHNKWIRDQEKAEAKAETKRLQAIEKAKERKPRRQINKVSDKQKDRLKEYSKVREAFLLGRWCAYHGRPCIPTTVHHSAGRIGDLLTDTTYFVALCMDAHRMIEERPEWAKENGYSVTRTNK